MKKNASGNQPGASWMGECRVNKGAGFETDSGFKLRLARHGPDDVRGNHSIGFRLVRTSIDAQPPLEQSTLYGDPHEEEPK